mmetsp:Transcript_93209/g.164904  ORF Transcript_93209/g.164904 Transcript_93209/m.164904 type:complete len:127 (+) Transcript_93209:58-438(+)
MGNNMGNTYGVACCCYCKDDALAHFVEKETWVRGDRDGSEFVFAIDTSSGESLGVNATPTKDGTLEIRTISPEGLVAQYNDGLEPKSKMRVVPGMFIVEVNGRGRSAVQLIEACKDKGTLNIVVRR